MGCWLTLGRNVLVWGAQCTRPLGLGIPEGQLEGRPPGGLREIGERQSPAQGARVAPQGPGVSDVRSAHCPSDSVSHRVADSSHHSPGQARGWRFPGQLPWTLAVSIVLWG